MTSSTTRIQLIQAVNQVVGTTPIGYLDVAEEVQVPVNYAAADIRDISKRAGTFSKTIKLPGTKNNNRLLGLLFDVNIVAGTFDINRLQSCHLLQDNIPVVQNAYLQVMRVVKSQLGLNEDESVTYEVLIKDNTSDFFTKLGSRELTDLDFSDFGHTFNAGTIISTFNHTVTQGYKYLAPWVDQPLNTPGANTSPTYTINDFKPSIYALKYWERIHFEAGFSYLWQTVGDPDVRFNKLLIPYNGGDVKITQAVNVAQSVIAEGPTTGFIQTDTNMSVTYVAPQPLFLPFNVEIQDPFNVYVPSTSTYTVANPLAAPLSYEFSFDLTFSLVVTNGSGGLAVMNQTTGPFRIVLDIVKLTGGNNGNAVCTIPLTAYSAPYNPQAPGTLPSTLQPGVNQLVAPITGTFTGQVTNVNAGDQLRVRPRIEGTSFQSATAWVTASGSPCVIDVDLQFTGTSQMRVGLSSEGQMFGSLVDMNQYVPAKIKQSDFIKSICMMYNLYVESDPHDITRLIYRHRDEFYDSGVVVDWTEKLDRGSDQVLTFLPELNKKRLILTYRADNDVYNTSYEETTSEIYGQQEVVFTNEYVKDIDTKTLLFSPTPMRPMYFGQVAPLLQGQNPETNIRILLDNGQVLTNPSYTIQDYPGVQINQNKFPFASHLDKRLNPTFDINFGVCDYYFYDLGQYTSNNLYNRFWKRTCGQMNSGKMLTALFYLQPSDIHRMRLNDKIRIDNAYFNINKIIDYDANRIGLTRVELLSVDDAIVMPRFGKESTVVQPWYNEANPAPQDTVAPVRPPKRIIAATSHSLKSSNLSSSTIDTDRPIDLYGKRNVLGSDFSGVVIGSDREINEPGFYIENWALTPGGLAIYGITIVDAGADEVLPIDKTDPVDVIDGGLGYVRQYGGSPRTTTTRVYFDGGLDRV